MTLGGNVCIRNGNELDFCWKEAIKSLLPVCDEVVVCDGESTDGTQQEIRDWALSEPKLKVCIYPWPNPVGDPSFWVKWINFGREHVKCDYHFQLDGDEVLHESSYSELVNLKQQGFMNRTIRISRLNFWRDHKHLIPPGHCCSHQPIRIAPSSMWLPSDGQTGHPLEGLPSTIVSDRMNIRICHYGFLRKREAFFEKEKLLQKYFFNDYDERMKRSEEFPGNWMQMPGISGWENNLVDYTGIHPQVAHQWLKDRGYE